MVDVSDGNVRASDGAIFRQVHVGELTDIEMQIPLGAVEDLVKLLRSTEAEKMGIGQTEDHLLFVIGGDVFIVTKNNVEYPDVEGMLLGPARKNKVNLTVDRAQFISAIRRTRNTADEDTKGVLLDISRDVLILKSRDKYGNWSDETMDVHFVDTDRTIGVNHENLIDALQAVDSPSVSVMLGEDTKTRKAPLFIEDGEVVAVLQQLKLEI
jgi:DNA polymerase III sliding clamp (beta) subunit (PCNA family)